ncbi:hypothetical protein DL96DRAFT_1816561 [Flagelloscypha sp. PMI_526]|nr:hypothetical protein DL96DRAFT_1816561 [Flagelloscypha sp. PMI_526]
MPVPGKGIRVISFDGPALDATGFSELLILEDIAGKWAWDREDDDREGGDVRISEFCDIVGGTGLGGFYAILFSLHMTVAQVITSHKILQDVLFSSEEWKRKDTIGCVIRLKTALARIIEEVGLEVDLDTPFLSKNSLKCFVCVLNDVTTGRPRALRNYRVRSSKSPHCTIREAIHVTFADGIHIPPVRTQDEQFICALSSFPNPSYELMKELPAVFPKGSELACFVNLGAGGIGLLRITSSEYREELAKAMKDAEVLAQNLIALCGGLGPCYFRLSAVTGANGSALDTTDDMVRIVKSLTVGYLEDADVGVHIDALVDTLVNRQGVVSLRRLGCLAAEDGKTTLNAQVDAVHDHVVHMKKTMDDELYCKIKNWLTPIDQTAKLDSCIRTRNTSTCGWLWNFQPVIKWREMGGFLWCHAGMGAGKTIIMSHVVETLMKLPDEYFVAYYYFEFTNPSTLSEEALFRSLVSQLSHANSAASRQLYEKHRSGSLHPQLTSLHESLCELVRGAPLPVYIIIDALDEFPLPGRRYLIESLLALSLLAVDGVHVMATSRDELDIQKGFSGKVSYDFAIEKEMVQHDIVVFVDQELSAEKWKSWPTQEVLNMRKILIDKADGMFRIVSCHIEVLNHAQSTEDMRQALASLPATLVDTYVYILDAIPSHLRARAYTLLSVLSVAFSPVSESELSTFLAVELGNPEDQVNLPVYREELCYHEPQNIVGLGTALIRRSTTRYTNEAILQLAHASVKEYLLQGSGSWCALNDKLAHETTARVCLALLIHNQNSEQSSGVANIRHRRQYIQENWWKHIPLNHRVQLLSQQKKLFETFPWTNSSIGTALESRDDLWDIVTFLGSPLVFAAAASLEQLLFTMLQPLTRWKINDLNDALQAAALMGSSTEIFTALIENGGDVNSTTTDGTPVLSNGARPNQLHVVQVLVEQGANVNMVGGFYASALQAAASRRAADTVKFLVECGADVTMTGGKYGSALQAAAHQGALDIVEFLVKSGAGVNARGKEYGSALQAAARMGALDVVKFLVENGADVNMDGGKYGSALQAAAIHAALDIVEFLVESGADVNIGGGRYGSVLEAAEGSDRDVMEEYKIRERMIEFLIAKGAVRSNGTTPSDDMPESGDSSSEYSLDSSDSSCSTQ